METALKLICALLTVAGFVYFVLYVARGKGRLESPGAWATLEKNFRVDAMPAAYTTTSGLVGLGAYRNTLQLAMDSTGVYLNLPAIARGGSKPVFIPYTEFTLSTTNPTVSRDVYDYTQFLVRGQSVCLDPTDARKIIERRQTGQH